MNTADSDDMHSTSADKPSLQRRATVGVIENSPPPQLERRNSRPQRKASQRTAKSRTSFISQLPIPKFSIAGLKRAATIHLQPVKPVGEAPSTLQGIKAIILMSWLNILLVCIPISWAFHFVWQNNTTPTQDTIIFVFSFLSIIPLAKLLAFATDELSIRVGQTLAGLLNATLGNAVELIVAILALIKCELQIVQSSLVGSILSNLLLVLGMCFFAGGTRFSEQGFGISSTQLNSSLLTISVIAVLLPAAFHFTTAGTDATEAGDILSVSHGAAIILLFVYGCYIYFQLSTHKNLYDDQNEEIMQSRKYSVHESTHRFANMRDRLFHRHPNGSTLPLDGNAETTSSPAGSTEEHVMAPIGSDVEANLIHDEPQTDAQTQETDAEEEPEIEEPQMSVYMTIGLLVVVTVLVAVTAEWLVSSIDGLTESGAISKEFVGLILLPIVGNAAEHVTAVTVSLKDKLTLSLGVAVGSSIQIALFVIPFIVTLGWIIGKPLTLLFDPFESIVLFLAVIVVNYTVADGRSNWLEGMILMCLYVMLAVVFWYYPGDSIMLSTC